MDLRQDPLHSLPAAIKNTPISHVSQAPSTQNALPSPSAKKRRTSTTGSRCVARLNPEQLAKKRQNDREAQKAIRERTKAQIEHLEKRIQELTDQKPYQELQDAIRQKEAVEAENKDIRQRLTSVLNIVQPLCGGTDQTAQPASYSQDAPLQGPVYGDQSMRARQAQLGAHASSNFNEAPSMRRGNSVSSTYNQSPRSSRQSMPSTPYTPQGPVNSSISNIDQRPSNINSRPPTDEKLDLGYLLQSRQNSTGSSQQYGPERTPSISSICNQTPNAASPLQNGHEENRPAYAVQPKTLNHHPLDGLLLTFLSDQRQRAMEGVPAQDLAGPPYPCFRALVEPQASEYSHPLSRVFTDMLGKFPDIATLPEQVAILYVMFLIMRWQVCPSQETYDQIPEWVTPRPSQLFTPHPAWIDHLPWPRMRDKLVRIYPSVPFENFFIPYTTTVSLNWPFNPNEVLLRMPPDSPELSINPAFERHLRDLGNWSLGPAFAKAHPSLSDTFRLRL